MPTYVCVVKAGLLNKQQKQRIASAITRLHSETTGAPTWLVQVVIDENEQRQRYLSGQPADHQIWIRGDIRAGRTSEQRQRLMLGIVQAVSEISGVEESAIWVYLCNLAPDDMVEYGHVLPQAGKEQAWFEALSSELQQYLTSIRMQNEKIAK
ncbi:MAG TPA: tautomerase family protein [Candidatus Binatia bacterium]|nr:tautomerase family protein [Candidatus Binatia bacterium]